MKKKEQKKSRLDNRSQGNSLNSRAVLGLSWKTTDVTILERWLLMSHDSDIEDLRSPRSPKPEKEINIDTHMCWQRDRKGKGRVFVAGQD